jgi:hypothetical protein
LRVLRCRAGDVAVTAFIRIPGVEDDVARERR